MTSTSNSQISGAASNAAGGSSAASAAETKKQRQNAARRDAQKAARAEAEAERLASLARHKRELERAKIAEQYSSKGKGGKTPDSKASVDANGKLVWD